LIRKVTSEILAYLALLVITHTFLRSVQLLLTLFLNPILTLDEIEELLEDLNRLEMASLDSFDIDGSQMFSNANRSRLQALQTLPSTEDSREMHFLSSPTVSVKSWDSHTHYQVVKLMMIKISYV